MIGSCLLFEDRANFFVGFWILPILLRARLDGFRRLPKDVLVRCFGSFAGPILRRFVYPGFRRVLPEGVRAGSSVALHSPYAIRAAHRRFLVRRDRHDLRACRIAHYRGALVALSSHFEWFLRAAVGGSDIRLGAIIAVFLLFAPATAALGMVAPFAVKLSLTSLEKTGRTVGNLYAISNAGSIVGTFLGGFVLISYLGSSRIMTIVSVILFLLAALVALASRSKPGPSVWAIAVLAVASGAAFPGRLVLEGKTVIADIDTHYSRNWVFEATDGRTGRPIRGLSNIADGYQSAMFADEPGELAFAYTKFYDLFEVLRPGAAKALMIGGSTYTYPRHFLSRGEGRMLDVVEIDPGVTEIARHYFGLESHPRLSIIHEDGRVFLNRNEKQYDVLFVDAFHSDFTIPYHLTTKEVAEAMRKSLVEEGVVMVNVIAALEGGQSSFLAAEYGTYAAVFPHVKVYQVDTSIDPSRQQNVMLVAGSAPLTPHSAHDAATQLESHEWTEGLPELPVLTDEFAPIERYTLLVR